MLRLAHQRIVNQQLGTPTLADPGDVVARLGAVQSQDYAGATWGIAQRMVDATAETVERAVTDGTIIRTHILRPTWHFVAAKDLRWLLALSAPRVKAACAYRWRTLELDDALFGRCAAALTKALRDGHEMTRADIAGVLERAKIDVTAPERLTHLMMRAELEGLVCSGTRKGKQFTYALLDERVPAAKPMKRDEALAELATRYFSTRGPATAHDFAWWSGLTVTDAKRALASIGDRFSSATVDGIAYWSPDSAIPRAHGPRAWLLPNFDEYFIGFADRGAMLERLDDADDVDKNALTFANTIVIDGQVVGTWKRKSPAKTPTVELCLRAQLKPAEHRAVAEAIERLGRFLGVPLTTAASPPGVRVIRSRGV